MKAFENLLNSNPRLRAKLAELVLDELMNGVEEIAERAYNTPLSPELIEPTGRVATGPLYYRVFTQPGHPVACRVCGSLSHWMFDPGWDSVHAHFVCAHPYNHADGIPIRQVDSLAMHDDRPGPRLAHYFELAHSPGDPGYPDLPQDSYERSYR
jgi:hypothetical protein